MLPMQPRLKTLLRNGENFRGIDVFISNAGILRAGGLDEMSPETFELMTRVNYNAYFLCAKYASCSNESCSIL